MAAGAALSIAKLNLERTKLTLPVDAIVLSENIDLGQYITVGVSIGRAYGTEAVEIELPLEDFELAWFEAPDITTENNNPDLPKTTAEIKVYFAGRTHSWQGYVTRTMGQVDIRTRFVYVVVEVPRPFEITNGRPALMPGIFVDVFIKGRTLKNVIAIPRDALHNGNEVWTVNDGTLHVRKLEIARMDKDFAYVTAGLKDDVEVISSSLDAVVDGMHVRTKTE